MVLRWRCVTNVLCGDNHNVGATAVGPSALGYSEGSRGSGIGDVPTTQIDKLAGDAGDDCRKASGPNCKVRDLIALYRVGWANDGWLCLGW
jgi:hypothetical protein